MRDHLPEIEMKRSRAPCDSFDRTKSLTARYLEVLRLRELVAAESDRNRKKLNRKTA